MSSFTEVLRSGNRQTERDFLDSYSRMIGVDEAGRGALAGPLYVGGCILTESDLDADWTDDVDDSKAYTVRNRRRVAESIREHAEDWIVVACEPWVIDERGIQPCLLSCMRTVVSELAGDDDLAAIDGNQDLGDVDTHSISVINGDERFKAIGAASILAKTAHDSFMSRLHFDYPSYEFQDNVGYGTGDHRIALDQEGPSPVHRVSFSPVSSMETDFEDRSPDYTLENEALSDREDPKRYIMDRQTG